MSDIIYEQYVDLMTTFDAIQSNPDSRIGIDRSTISSILTGEKELTKWHKAAFYYFFKYNEVSQF